MDFGYFSAVLSLSYTTRGKQLIHDSTVFGRIYIYLSFKGEITDYDISSIAIITYTSIELDLRPRSSLSLVGFLFVFDKLFFSGRVFFIQKFCSSSMFCFFVIGVILFWEGKNGEGVVFFKKKKIITRNKVKRKKFV